MESMIPKLVLFVLCQLQDTCSFQHNTKYHGHDIQYGWLKNIGTPVKCSLECGAALAGKAKFFSFSLKTGDCFCKNGRAKEDPEQKSSYVSGSVGCAGEDPEPERKEKTEDTRQKAERKESKAVKSDEKEQETTATPEEQKPPQTEDAEIDVLPDKAKSGSAMSKIFRKSKSFLKSPFNWAAHGVRKAARSFGLAGTFNVHMQGNKQLYYLKDWAVQDESAKKRYAHQVSGNLSTEKVTKQTPSFILLQFDTDEEFCRSGIEAFSPRKVYLRVFKTSRNNPKCNEVEGIKGCLVQPLKLNRRTPIDAARVEDLIVPAACTKLKLTEVTNAYETYSIGYVFRPTYTQNYPDFDKLTLLIRAYGNNCKLSIDSGGSDSSRLPMLSWGEHTGSENEKEELGLTSANPFENSKWALLDPLPKDTVEGKQQSKIKNGEKVNLKYNLPPNGLEKPIGVEFKFEGRFLDTTTISFMTSRGVAVFTVVVQTGSLLRSSKIIRKGMRQSSNTWTNIKDNGPSSPLRENKDGVLVVQHKDGNFWVAAKYGTNSVKYEPWSIFKNNWQRSSSPLKSVTDILFQNIGWPAKISGKVLKQNKEGTMPEF